MSQGNASSSFGFDCLLFLILEYRESFSTQQTLAGSDHQSRNTRSDRGSHRASLDQHLIPRNSNSLYPSDSPSNQSVVSFSTTYTNFREDRAGTGVIAADDLEFPGNDPVEISSEHVQQLPMECEACEATESVFWCHICDVTVCHDCWIRQAAHGATRKQTRGNHEQTDLGLRDIIQWILRPHNDRHADDRHAMDCYTKWFGVTIQPGEEGDVSLQTTPRYRELSVGVGVDNHQYPALISFVGETGAGKSTLISALMKVFGNLNPF